MYLLIDSGHSHIMTGIASAADFTGKFKSKLDDKIIEGDTSLSQAQNTACCWSEMEKKGRLLSRPGKTKQRLLSFQ